MPRQRLTDGFGSRKFEQSPTNRETSDLDLLNVSDEEIYHNVSASVNSAYSKRSTRQHLNDGFCLKTKRENPGNLQCEDEFVGGYSGFSNSTISIVKSIQSIFRKSTNSSMSSKTQDSVLEVEDSLLHEAELTEVSKPLEHQYWGKLTNTSDLNQQTYESPTHETNKKLPHIKS